METNLFNYDRESQEVRLKNFHQRLGVFSYSDLIEQLKYWCDFQANMIVFDTDKMNHFRSIIKDYRDYYNCMRQVDATEIGDDCVMHYRIVFQDLGSLYKKLKAYCHENDCDLIGVLEARHIQEVLVKPRVVTLQKLTDIKKYIDERSRSIGSKPSQIGYLATFPSVLPL